MSRKDSRLHDTGDFFPVMEFRTIRDETIVLPGDLLGKWNVVLLYRGRW